MRILVAVPTYENIYPDTFKSIYQLDRAGHDLDFDFFRGYDVANARNQIGRAVLDRGFDYVLMVDNDEVIPRDALVNLLASQKGCSCAVTVGYCLSRPRNGANDTGRTTAFKFGGKDYVREDAYTGKELADLGDRGTNRVQIRGCGLGCALIPRAVFEKVGAPWFRWVLYDNGAQLSEDLFFCEKLKENSIPVFVDTRVMCGHMMRFVKWPIKEG